MLQTFWTSFNIIAYSPNAKIFYNKSDQTFLGLNLKTTDILIDYAIFLLKTLI